MVSHVVRPPWQTPPAAVIPVVAIERSDDALALARALLEGGIAVIEITLRTDAAWQAIEQVVRELPAMRVGVGTLLNRQDAARAAELGVAFAVSPGLTPAIAEACLAYDVPLLPGVATASEVMLARELGFRLLKFFPAAAAGGVAMLRALAGPFADIRFCPTGGIDVKSARDYLGLDNVVCVGGGWVAPPTMIRERRWADITALAAEAALLTGSAPRGL